MSVRRVVLAIASLWLVVGGVLGYALVSLGGEGGEIGKPGTPTYNMPYTYNAWTGAYKANKGEKVMRYNPYKRGDEAWSYEKPDARVKYNAFEDEWGYEK